MYVLCVTFVFLVLWHGINYNKLKKKQIQGLKWEPLMHNSDFQKFIIFRINGIIPLSDKNIELSKLIGEIRENCNLIKKYSYGAWNTIDPIKRQFTQKHKACSKLS